MNHLKYELEAHRSYTGGGLATPVTGKFESVRNALAKCNPDKRTAGEIAKSLRKEGLKVYAKDVKQFCEEWHHAGKLPWGGMAKTYYSKKTNVEFKKFLNL